ncbi:MAG TPA: tetratricopeptide repeat protein [Planctomycetota bacterium]|nr:tetratricopeptide repeat protein [Planctomycetota bacterium]
MRLLLSSLVFAVVLACSREPDAPSAKTVQAAGTPPAPARSAKVLPVQLPQSSDPKIVACASALETGDLSQAQSLLLELADDQSPDSHCLRARLLAAKGDGVGALREIETARKRWPDQACLFATLAEIHATGGRLESAQAEIRAGLAAAGPTPDLSRASGVVRLLQQGGAKAGMAHLLEAVHSKPDLFFTAAPLSEAHRLLATEALAKQNPIEALSHARAGLELEPKNPELRLLLADALVASGNYDDALPAYEEFAKEGRDLGATLRLYYQKGAMAALVDGKAELAVERYLRARQLGASDEELNFGAGVLHRAAADAQTKADQAFDDERWGDARSALGRVLSIEADDLAARTQLGVVCFKLEDYPSAEACWRRVLEGAETQKLVLPDPVHLKLASALKAQGKESEIKPLLESYLATQPDGEWAQLTREALARLTH